MPIPSKESGMVRINNILRSCDQHYEANHVSLAKAYASVKDEFASEEAFSLTLNFHQLRNCGSKTWLRVAAAIIATRMLNPKQAPNRLNPTQHPFITNIIEHRGDEFFTVTAAQAHKLDHYLGPCGNAEQYLFIMGSHSPSVPDHNDRIHEAKQQKSLPQGAPPIPQPFQFPGHDARALQESRPEPIFQAAPPILRPSRLLDHNARLHEAIQQKSFTQEARQIAEPSSSPHNTSITEGTPQNDPTWTAPPVPQPLSPPCHTDASGGTSQGAPMSEDPFVHGGLMFGADWGKLYAPKQIVPGSLIPASFLRQHPVTRHMGMGDTPMYMLGEACAMEAQSVARTLHDDLSDMSRTDETPAPEHVNPSHMNHREMAQAIKQLQDTQRRTRRKLARMAHIARDCHARAGDFRTVFRDIGQEQAKNLRPGLWSPAVRGRPSELRRIDPAVQALVHPESVYPQPQPTGPQSRQPYVLSQAAAVMQSPTWGMSVKGTSRQRNYVSSISTTPGLAHNGRSSTAGLSQALHTTRPTRNLPPAAGQPSRRWTDEEDSDHDWMH